MLRRGEHPAGAEAIAAFADIVHSAFRIRFFQRLENFFVISDAQKDVCFGERRKQFADELLRQTARHHYFFHFSLLFIIRTFKNRLYGFLSRGSEKRTGVDDDDLRL